jgi:HEAT repeat protein
MATRAQRVFLLALVVLSTLFFACPAGAAPHDPQTLALGWLVEHADAVVVAVPTFVRPLADSGIYEVTLEIEESIRGDLVRQSTAVLLVEHVEEQPPYTLMRRHLAFLRALPVEEGRPALWAPVSGEFGVRPIPVSGAGARFPELCRQIAAALGDAAGYRALLVRTIEDEDPGIAWSAATDLVRHHEMHEALTGDEKARIVSAFERQPIGKDTKKALARAASVTLDSSAAPALVNSLLHPRANEIRLEVGVALRRLESAETVTLLVGALSRAEPRQAVNLLNALGTMAPASPAAAEAARIRVLDEVSAIRIEAAHALGLVARRLQRANPVLRLRGREDLVLALARAGSANEQLAAVWALAQYDEPEAYDALRTLAASDERPLVRKAAERYLANPRLSLVLR